MKRLIALLALLMLFCSFALAESSTGYFWDVPVGIPMDEAVEALREKSGEFFLYTPNPYVDGSIYTAKNVDIEGLSFEFVASDDDDGNYWNLTGLYSDFIPVSLSGLGAHSPALFSSITRLLNRLVVEFGSPVAACWNFDEKYANPNFDIPLSDSSIDFARILSVSEKYTSELKFYWEHVYLSVYFKQSDPQKSYISIYLNSSEVHNSDFVSSGDFSEDILNPPLPPITDPDDLGIWELTYYVDKFKQPTGDAYIRNTSLVNGTFSNSATNDSKLRVRFLIDDNSISMMLYEYGDHQVKNSYSSYDKEYDIYVLDALGTQHEFYGYIRPNGDRIYIDDDSYFRENEEDFLTILKRGGTVRFYIEESEREVNQYNFSIDDATGFAAAYDKLMDK